MTNYNNDDYESAFVAFMNEHGFYPPTPLTSHDGGAPTRFHPDGDDRKGKPCFYYFNLHREYPSGTVGDFRTGEKFSWSSFIIRETSDYDRDKAKTYAIESAKKKKLLDLERIRISRETWDKASPCENHPYLEKKHVLSYGLRSSTKFSNNDTLLVPGYSRDGEMCAVQQIYWSKKDKSFQKRWLGPSKGAFYPLNGMDGEIICLAEGYSTAATIAESTGLNTIFAGNCDNMCSVAVTVRDIRPHARVVICADDDWKTPGNPGLTWGEKARRACSAMSRYPHVLVYPNFRFGGRREKETDFNDLAVFAGLDEVRMQIMHAIER